MAIAKIKHIDIFFTKYQKERIFYLIQKLGVFQFIQRKEVQLASPAKDIEEIQEAIDYLDSLKTKRGFFPAKPLFTEEGLDSILKGFDSAATVEYLVRVRERIKSIQAEVDKLYHTKKSLLPWQKLRIPLKEIKPTQYVEIILGTIDKRYLPDLEKELKENKLNIYLESINQEVNPLYILIIYLKEKTQEINSLFKKHNFNHVALPDTENTAQEAISEINASISRLNAEKQRLLQEVSLTLLEKIQLMALADKLNNENMRKELSSKTFETNYVSLISGWIKEKDLPRLKNTLSATTDLEIMTRDPREDEDVPVDLENARLIQPFEFITKIYGMPKYSELDPTPFLAPFFFLYFGFCVSDAGYGMLLALISWFVLRKFRMGPQGMRFFRLFFFCGISTIIVGALTGSWFGNLFDLLADSHKIFLPLKKFKDALIILDPMKEPTKLLGIALSFGIIQVWFGNIVAAIANFKNKRYLDILLDQVSTLTLLFGLTGLGLIFLNLLDKANLNLFKYAALLGTIALILTQGRSEKNLGAKLFYGIFNLYSAISGYLADTLSYSRLWALGLVTSVMATTINLISIQFSQIIPTTVPFINKINFIKLTVSSLVLIIIFVFGHLVSFLMNLLGAFVHPVRLQFVEFFSKFFKTSGDSFKPFKVETKYINISETTTYGTQ